MKITAPGFWSVQKRSRGVGHFLIFPREIFLHIFLLSEKMKWNLLFDTPQMLRLSDRKSILMRLYSPVDLTGNMSVIEKLVLGRTWTGDLPIFSPMH